MPIDAFRMNYATPGDREALRALIRTHNLPFHHAERPFAGPQALNRWGSYMDDRIDTPEHVFYGMRGPDGRPLYCQLPPITCQPFVESMPKKMLVRCAASLAQAYIDGLLGAIAVLRILKYMVTCDWERAGEMALAHDANIAVAASAFIFAWGACMAVGLML